MAADVDGLRDANDEETLGHGLYRKVVTLSCAAVPLLAMDVGDGLPHYPLGTLCLTTFSSPRMTKERP